MYYKDILNVSFNKLPTRYSSLYFKFPMKNGFEKYKLVSTNLVSCSYIFGILCISRDNYSIIVFGISYLVLMIPRVARNSSSFLVEHTNMESFTRYPTSFFTLQYCTNFKRAIMLTKIFTFYERLLL